MKNNSGKFKCPKCGYNKINSFGNWFSREEFINNELKTKWIFYEDEKKEWECCICCKNCCFFKLCGQSLICCCTKEVISDDVYFFSPCYPCTLIIYLLLFFWIDLIYFLCIKTKDYIGLSGKNNTNLLLGKDKDSIWDDVEGLTEEQWNSKYKKNWQCIHCKYSCNSFIEFISDFKPNAKKQVIELNELNNIKSNTNIFNTRSEDKKILINFSSSDGKVSFGLSCKKTEIFNLVLKRLYDKYPEYKNKNCHFLSGGNLIDINKTIDENKIKSDDNIIILNPNIINSIIDDEQIAIQFSSNDQKIQYCLPCKKTDRFDLLLKKLYLEYPEYENKKCYFLANGNIININKTLAENNIKSSDNIILNCDD